MKKTVLITGASSGIGKATAQYFADQGWNVAATMRRPEKEKDLVETDALKLFRLDVQDQDSIDLAVKNTINAFGSLDALVNNAGYGAIGPLEESSRKKIERQFDVNVFGLIEVTKAVLPQMRKQKSGVIVNISSVGGRITLPLTSLYHGTKWAVEGITQSLQYELNPLGIKLKIVEPGGVKTDFTTRSIDFEDNEIPDYDPIMGKMKNMMNDNSNMPSTPLDIAKVIFKATTDGRKKLRYAAGKDAKLFMGVLRVFGDNAVQRLLKSYLKL
ncbi:MAG: SDR family oxidoreductase [Bacteroidota bacterium]